MKLTIVYPARSHSAYKIAAEIFSELAESVLGLSSQIVTDEEFDSTEKGDVAVLIGHDGENEAAAALYLAGRTDSFGIRYCTDDYCIRSLADGEKRYLMLAGGRPRATIYAVYRYFEVFCGCRWFWDGDRMTRLDDMPFDNIDLTESPRFDYRGLRYFAHRSLHRFQAEHWNFEDWKQEIDWMLKKRLNLFMMRIGMDDVWQKAFPELVSYPGFDKPLAEATEGYDDRNLFWSLEYRGELRKKILSYAFERDLMHPEDCGTMSHWYSRTPCEFLDKAKPELLPQATTGYSEPTGRVFDVRKRKNFDIYKKLTETHVAEYGKPELFHTIGLGERLYSKDAEENKRMKLYVYRKIASYVKEKYPNAPLLIASWDLWIKFTEEEVRALIAELDPTQSIILDYTSDTSRKNNFTKWNVVNKFPWIFGMFSGFEPNSEIRGFYELTNERIKLAKDDPMCKGVILWPELSHGDSFMIEYLAQNAWNTQTPSVAEQTDKYSADRYPEAIRGEMAKLWREFMPIVELESWSMDNTYPIIMYGDIFVRSARKAPFKKDEADKYRQRAEQIGAQKRAAVGILNKLAALECDDELTRRDFFDIARTVIGRFINGAIYHVEALYCEDAGEDALKLQMDKAEALLKCLTKLLAAHEDYSMLKTLRRMQESADVNPKFEETLKNNAECFYCRSYIYENSKYIYEGELKNLFEEVLAARREGREINTDTVKARNAKSVEVYYNTPLAEMERETEPFGNILAEAVGVIETLFEC